MWTTKTAPGFSEQEDLMLQAKITLELLRELPTRNAEAHVKTTTGHQRRFHRFAQKAHGARRWIYRSVQQTGLTMARQQIQMLEQGLDVLNKLVRTVARGSTKPDGLGTPPWVTEIYFTPMGFLDLFEFDELEHYGQLFD
ncbi:hypothetical protein CBS147326_9429 [Penicillium roqueforti]|nr:hypothetical protein CBS147326_9429 [Penicillium roqueforti]